MSTKQETVDFLTEQMSTAGAISSRKMFGEYGIYCDEKIVALVCDDNLFVKPSAASAALEKDCEYAPPYPGAKPYLKVSSERWDDATWLADLIRQTADALPAPIPNRKS